MKIAKGFILSQMPGKEGEYIVLGVGEATNKLKGFLSLNETGVFIWKALEKGVTKEEIVSMMIEEYDAPQSVIEADVDAVVNTLRGIGAIDD